jgi:hypothetical protein
MAKIVVNDELIEQIKTKHTEYARLDITDVVDLALRKMLKEGA